MPENENTQENTEINSDYSSVSENTLSNELLNDVLNELKVINENEALIIERLDKIGTGSVSSNELSRIRSGVNEIHEEIVSANTITYDGLIITPFSEYSLTDSLLLLCFIMLFLLTVHLFLKGKNVF